MNFSELSDVAKVIMGQSPPSSTYNTVGNGLPFFQGKADFGELYPTPRVYCSEPNRIAEPGDILITVRAPVGPTNLNRERSCIGRGLSAIRVGKNLDRDYLLYFLRFYEPQLANAGAGSTFNAISRDDLETIKIPLPPLDEQRRIAARLSRADQLRRLRHYASQLGEGYLGAAFVEMFGDPIKNTKKIKMKKIGSLTSVKTGGTPSREVPEYYGGKILWVKTTEVINGIIYDTEENITEKGLKASNCEIFPIDTILVAMYGQGLTRGRTAKLGIQATTNQACAAILPSERINTNYLWTFLKLSYDRLRDLGRGGNQPNLNLSMVKEFEVPYPLLAEQERFAARVARYERLRSQQREAERQTEMLFQSLLAQSYNVGLSEAFK